MLRAIEINRYSRQIQLDGIGLNGQFKLRQSKVLVVGAGGLGCPVLQYLSAAGVGTLGIVDFDKIELSNLQRQVLYDEAHIGKYKAAVAAEKIKKQNSSINVIAFCEKLTQQNIANIFPAYDLVVDCSDNFSTRYLVNDACVVTGKSMVYGAVHRYEGQVSVFNDLKKSKFPVTYRCLFPEPPDPGAIPSCEHAGVLGVLPGIIGTMQANEAIKLITGFGEVLSGKLFLFDSRTMETSLVELSRNPETTMRTPASMEELKQTNYDFDCEIISDKSTLSAFELDKFLKQKKSILFLDVRQPGEKPVMNELLGINIPLDVLENKLADISRDRSVVIYCRSGRRSAKALEILSGKYGFKNVFNLSGGVEEWMRYKKLQGGKP